MPTNLPPEYFEAEKTYKEARSTSEKISALENLISTIPKHKGTDKLRADLRRRLSKLRTEGDRAKKSGRGDLYNVQKEGAAQIALMGFPNSGKSSLLKSLTNANPSIADYPMSTVMPLPGMMPFEDILIQLVDLPPVGNESSDGWISGIIRNTDVVLVVVDLSDDPDTQAELLLDLTVSWHMESKPMVIAANKIDSPGVTPANELLKKKLGDRFPVIPVSTIQNRGLEELRNELFSSCRIIRVYSKQPGKEPDMKTPFTLPSGTTVHELAERIHKDFVHNMKYACVWGAVKIQGQRVQREYVLKDKDIVEIHI